MVNVSSPARQAREGLSEFYTASQDRDLSLFYNEGDEAVIKQDIHVKLTSDAEKKLVKQYIPVIWLFKGRMPEYDRAYPVDIKLQKPEKGKNTRKYKYKVTQRRYFPKDILEVLPREEEFLYEGTIVMERKGLRWQVADFK